MPNWKKVIVSGSDASLNSLNVSTYVSASTFSGKFTGSLQGSSSYALTASYAQNVGFNTSESFTNQSTWTFNHNLSTPYVIIQTFDTDKNEMIPQTTNLLNNNTAIITFPTLESGYAVASVGGALGGVSTATSSYSLTASYVQNALTASFYNTSSLATTGSNVFSGSQNITGSVTVTGSLVVSGSGTFRNIGPAQFTGSLAITGSMTINSGSIIMPNRPAFRVTGAGGGKTAVTALSGSYLIVDYQQGGGWDNTTGTFTAPIAGLYQVNVVTRTNSNALGTISQLIVYKNNTGGTTGDVQIMIEYGINTTMNHAGGSTISRLAVGDTLKMVVAVGQISFDANDNFSVAYLG
jgi:hypothetical protein